MNFLFVLHYPDFGGPTNQALRLTGALHKRGWETIVLVPEGRGNAAARLRCAGIEVVQAPLHRLRATFDPGLQFRFVATFASDVRGIRRLIRERRIDIVVIPGLANPHGAIAARLERIPVVWQVLDSRVPGLIRTFLMILVRLLADAIMFTGTGLIQLHAGRRPLTVPSFVFYPPVDIERFVPSSVLRGTVRAELGIPKHVPVIGMVGNLNPQKGIEYFIRTAAIVREAMPLARFIIIGPTLETHRDYAERLRLEAKRLNLTDEQLTFLGGRSELERFYPAMDVALITSVPRSEGVPTTALEAMACGVPVVATDVGAVREVIDDGVTGFLVPARDQARLAAATLRILRDPALHDSMSTRARQRTINNYDVDTSAEKHVEAFEGALRRHRSRHVTPISS